MTQRTQAFVLLLFGGALLRLATTDALLRYVRPVARPWVLLAGAAIVALALWSLFTRPHRPAARDEHGHGSSRTGWLVLAPVIAILVIAPPALGAYSAKRLPVSALTPPSRQFPALTGGTDPVKISLLDYYGRAAFGGGQTLTGHRLSLSAFVLRPEPGGFQVARLVITCCAADAQPVVLAVRTSTPAPARDTWVTVIGTFGGMSPTDATVPVLRADTVTPVRQPANPYD